MNFPSKDAPFSPSEPFRLDGYRVVRELERGGMGEILLARELDSDREVVIKWISASGSGERGPEWKRRLEKETQVLSQIDHEHVVRVLDSGANSERAWLVMEYVEGGTLRDRIGEGRALSRSELRQVLRELGSALEALHAQDIVHRDLKPENVLLDAAGRVKVADFGLATPLGDVGNLTVTGQVLGTADYLSPEQKYRLPVDERSDQYALAVVAYELMTGRKPLGSFSGPSEKDDTLSSAVDAACLRALSEDPDDRYESVSAFVAALDAGLGATSRRKFIERPVPVIAGAVALGILIAGAWGFGTQGLEPSIPEPSESIANASESASSDSPSGPPPEVRVIDEIQGGEPPRLLTADGLTQEELDEFNELMVLAMGFGENNQWELSLKKCDQALEIRPASGQAHYNRGCALHALMQLDDAIAAYSEAIDLDPTLARAHGNLAYLLETARGDFQGALQGYKAAIDAEPLERQHHVNLFKLLKRMEHYGEVVEAYDAWLEIDPEDREVREDLAYMLCVCPDAEAVDVERGMDLAQELCESSEWSAWRSLKVLAIAQLYSGQEEEGLASAKRSVELIEPERRESYRERLTLFFPELAGD